jgi:hypothetical protein
MHISAYQGNILTLSHFEILVTWIILKYDKIRTNKISYLKFSLIKWSYNFLQKFYPIYITLDQIITNLYKEKKELNLSTY